MADGDQVLMLCPHPPPLLHLKLIVKSQSLLAENAPSRCLTCWIQYFITLHTAPRQRLSLGLSSPSLLTSFLSSKRSSATQDRLQSCPRWVFSPSLCFLRARPGSCTLELTRLYTSTSVDGQSLVLIPRQMDADNCRGPQRQSPHGEVIVDTKTNVNGTSMKNAHKIHCSFSRKHKKFLQFCCEVQCVSY